MVTGLVGKLMLLCDEGGTCKSAGYIELEYVLNAEKQKFINLLVPIPLKCPFPRQYMRGLYFHRQEMRNIWQMKIMQSVEIQKMRI